MQPGDMIFLEGRVIQHVIQEWSGQQQISIPIFTHTNIWKIVKELADHLKPDEDVGEK